MATITEWEEVLLKKGIIKKTADIGKETDEPAQGSSDQKQKQRRGNQMQEEDEIDDLLEDDIEDDDFMRRYRDMRLSELKATVTKQESLRYGEVIEISGSEYVEQVNKAGKDVWVVVHLYDDGVPSSRIINEHLKNLAIKFPFTKFIKSIATLCIPNFPLSQLPAIFVYHDGELKNKIVGASAFGDPLTQDALEWIIASLGPFKTDLESDPRNRIKVNRLKGRSKMDRDSSDDSDSY